MYVSPEDVAFAMGYLQCFMAQDGNKDLCEYDEWFCRGNIDFNLHNYSGPWQIDAYEVVNDTVQTDHFVCVWREEN
jgi:hypothetical protein